MSNFEDSFENYFKTSDVINDKKEVKVEDMVEKSSRPRMTAKGNISDIDAFGDVIRKLLNAAWGSKWGLIAPDTAKGEDPNIIKTPQINYGVNLREITPNSNPKATLMDTVNEVVDGKNTGDAFQVYRKFYDCIIEFNFWDTSSKGCRDLMNKFEDLMDVYSGFLKNQGVSEIFFLKEVPPSYSLNYVEGTPMKCIYFFVRLERIKTVRLSTIKEIEYRLSNNLKSEENSDDIKQKITYKL